MNHRNRPVRPRVVGDEIVVTLDDSRLSNIIQLRPADATNAQVGAARRAAVVDTHLGDLFCLVGILLLVPVLRSLGLLAPGTARPTFIFVSAFLVGLLLLRAAQRSSRSVIARGALYLAGFLFIAEWMAVLSLLLRRIL